MRSEPCAWSGRVAASMALPQGVTHTHRQHACLQGTLPLQVQQVDWPRCCLVCGDQSPAGCRPPTQPTLGQHPLTAMVRLRPHKHYHSMAMATPEPARKAPFIGGLLPDLVAARQTTRARCLLGSLEPSAACLARLREITASIVCTHRRPHSSSLCIAPRVACGRCFAAIERTRGPAGALTSIRCFHSPGRPDL